MLVKTEFKFLWGGKPKKETFENVVKITSKAPYTEGYSQVTLHFKDGHTEKVDYSSISIELEEGEGRE